MQRLLVMILALEQDIGSDNMNNNDDLEYIKNFSQITIREVCKKAGVDPSNLWSGRTAKKNIKKVRKLLESEVAKLYIIEDYNNE